MDSKFDQLMQKYGIVEEKNETSLMTTNSLPVPGTEVKFLPNASSHPYIKSKGQEFQDRVAKYISENKKKTRKYRLIISAVNTIRTGTEYAGESGGPLGFLATVTEQQGPSVGQNSFTVPLETLEIVNAAYNANAADIPDSWKYDQSRFNRFNEIVKGYFDRGEQPKGTIQNPS